MELLIFAMISISPRFHEIFSSEFHRITPRRGAMAPDAGKKIKSRDASDAGALSESISVWGKAVKNRAKNHEKLEIEIEIARAGFFLAAALTQSCQL